ncbi:MAG: glycosyltransferase family 2 protein [Methanosarcina sp.]|jgi:glycosyltransferase involved in cell wall biosynthesis|nr:glycosyltransferase family 2 protein [Methanosarcina sp.]
MVDNKYHTTGIYHDDYVVIEPSESAFKGNQIDLTNLPRVSFVIPVFNSERTLDECLSSIVNQDYPDVEIIVVDNGSTDQTIEIAKKYTHNIYFDNGKLGSVRQTGIEHATGEIVGSFDSDNYFPYNNWLLNSINYFNYSSDVGTVWPKNIAPLNRPLFMKMYMNFNNLLLEDRIKRKRGIVGGGCALFLKKAIDDVGGIDRDVHWGEDFNLAKKLKDKGYKLVYIKDPIYHDTDMGLSIKKFVKKQILGANAFTKDNFQSTGLSIREIFHEQVTIGTIGMIRGIIKEKDISWLLFPFLLFIRLIIYGLIFAKNLLRFRSI